MDDGTEDKGSAPDGTAPSDGDEELNEGSPEGSERPAESAMPPPEVVAPQPAGDQQPQPTATGTTHRKSGEERRAALAQAIQNEVVQGGRIESQSEFQAVLVFGKPVNHLLQLGLSVITCGVWLIVWLGLVIFGGEKRVMVSIDEYGNVLRQKIK